MRIVIDLQVAQLLPTNTYGQCGALNFAKSLAKNIGSHELKIVLNNCFPDSIDPIVAFFHELVPPEDIHVFEIPCDIELKKPTNMWRRRGAELLREAFIASLQPDIVFFSNFFGGLTDKTVASLNLQKQKYLTVLMVFEKISLLKQTQRERSREISNYYVQKEKFLHFVDYFICPEDGGIKYSLEKKQIDTDKILSFDGDTYGRSISKETIKVILKFFEVKLKFKNTPSKTNKIKKNKLAYVSSFIFDQHDDVNFDSNILKELTFFYNITTISENKAPSIPSSLADFPNQRPDWFKEHFGDFDRVIYFLCNDPKCFFMLDLIDKIAGTVVLKDASLVRMFYSDYNENLNFNNLIRQLYETHGYHALINEKKYGKEFVSTNYLASISVIENALGVIVNSTPEKKLVQSISQLADHTELHVISFSNIRQNWLEVAQDFCNSLELFATESSMARQKDLIHSFGNIESSVSPGVQDLIKMSASIYANRSAVGLKKIFIDVSAIVKTDWKTGIQRVIKNILIELFNNTPDGYRVEPVYFDIDSYKSASQFALHLIEYENALLEDSVIIPTYGDIFLGLDLLCPVPDISLLKTWRNRGVYIFFIVYDLLPLLKPEVFPEGVKHSFFRWLEEISAISNGLIAISRSVANELYTWLHEHPPKRYTDLQIGYYYNGASFTNSVSSQGLPDNANKVLSALSSKTTLLMVGTVEPRKGHIQAIEAFEFLWNQGLDINLVIVGQEGWTHIERNKRQKVLSIVNKIVNHDEFNKRLFWLDGGISDEYLDKIYNYSSALLAASEGEGFGLPLIEAAHHNLPIIARDIPVFREVANEHAFFFSAEQSKELADAIIAWLNLFNQNREPSSKGMPWLEWKQSAEQLLDVILYKNWYTSWSLNKKSF